MIADQLKEYRMVVALCSVPYLHRHVFTYIYTYVHIAIDLLYFFSYRVDRERLVLSSNGKQKKTSFLIIL